MARILYRIGGFAARRAGVVISLWIVALLGLGAAFAAFQAPLSDELEIPGTESVKLQDRISDQFDADPASGGGSAILTSTDGGEIPASTRDRMKRAIDEVEDIDGVEEVSDPFAQAEDQKDARHDLETGRDKLDDGQKKIDDSRDEIKDGKSEIKTSQKEIDNGKDELAKGQKELDAGQAELDRARDQIPAEAPPEAGAELDAQQREIDASQRQLDAQTRKLEAGQKKLDDNRDDLKDGKNKLTDKQKKLDDKRDDLQRNEKLLDLSDGYDFVSDSGSAALIDVSFDQPIGEVDPATLTQVRDALSGAGGSGASVVFDDNLEGDSGGSHTAELIGLGLALVILVIMLGSLIAAGLPILMSLIGLGAALMGGFALSSVIEMNSTTPALATMLGIAVGIDYSLFIISRHRSNLAQGFEIRESIARATGTAGNAVLFAGSTVIIALLGLNVVGIPFLSAMGDMAAFAIVASVAVALTLLPAVLSLIGKRVMSKRKWREIRKEHTDAEAAPTEERPDRSRPAESQPATGWLRMITKHPVMVIIGSVLTLGVIAVPAAGMQLGIPGADSQSPDSGANQSYHLIADEFGQGRNGPIVAVAELPDGIDDDQAEKLQVDLGEKLLALPDVAEAVPADISDDNSMLIYQVVPDSGPNDQETLDLVHDIRDLSVPTDDGTVTFGVTGQAAILIDMSSTLQDVLPIYLAIVIGLSLIVLMLVFRSVLVPLTATIGFLFSYVAAMGATTAVFQWGWLDDVFGLGDPGPVLSFLPILAVGILFGLAMDYQIFLVSGMREAHSHGKPARAAIVAGYRSSVRVVVAAGLIMVGVFAGFAFSGDVMTASIGFALAMGILFDAFVVRLTLIPALMQIFGEKAWWIPRWLDRLVPNVDVEGESLQRGLEDADHGDEREDTSPRSDADLVSV